MTDSSLHFYGLMNAKMKDQIHIDFASIYGGMKYSYLGKNNSIRLDYYSNEFPLILIF